MAQSSPPWLGCQWASASLCCALGTRMVAWAFSLRKASRVFRFFFAHGLFLGFAWDRSLHPPGQLEFSNGADASCSIPAGWFAQCHWMHLMQWLPGAVALRVHWLEVVVMARGGQRCLMSYTS